jgi:hypothetical protein
VRHGVDKGLQISAVRLLDGVLRQPIYLKPLYGRDGKQVFAGEHDNVGELDQLHRQRDDLILELTRKVPGIDVEQVVLLQSPVKARAESPDACHPSYGATGLPISPPAKTLTARSETVQT